MEKALMVVVDHGNISIRKGRRKLPLSLEEAQQLRQMMNNLFPVSGPYYDATGITPLYQQIATEPKEEK